MQYTSILSLPWVELSDSPNASTATRNLAEAMDSYGIPRYANATARDAAIPTPTQGQLCYITASGVNNKTLQVYRSQWRNMCETPLFKRQTSNQSKLNNDTLEDTHLIFQLEASSEYTFHGMILYSAHPDRGMRLAYRFPSGASITVGSNTPHPTSTASIGESTTRWSGFAAEWTSSSPITFDFPGVLDNAGPVYWQINAGVDGYIRTGATPGELGVQFSQFSAGSEQATVFYTGSFLVLTRVG